MAAPLVPSRFKRTLPVQHELYVVSRRQWLIGVLLAILTGCAGYWYATPVEPETYFDEVVPPLFERRYLGWYQFFWIVPIAMAARLLKKRRFSEGMFFGSGLVLLQQGIQDGMHVAIAGIAVSLGSLTPFQRVLGDLLPPDDPENPMVGTLTGFFLTLMVHGMAWWVMTCLLEERGDEFLAIGLVQLVYIIPGCLLLHFALHRSFMARGLLIGAVMTFLLNMTCALSYM